METPQPEEFQVTDRSGTAGSRRGGRRRSRWRVKDRSGTAGSRKPTGPPRSQDAAKWRCRSSISYVNPQTFVKKSPSNGPPASQHRE